MGTLPAYVRGSWDTTDHVVSDHRYLPAVGMQAYTTSGVIGYPSQATAEKGRASLAHLGQAAGTLIDLLTTDHT